MGETHLGAYAEKARVKGDWLVRLPASMSPRDAMSIGTAGYTAMLAVMALERAGVTPARGPVIVTGAAGGVGSVAVALLAKLGYAVTASTGRSAEAGYLKGLGASEVIEREELTGAPRPLGRERWAGGIDAVGSTTLANVLSMTRYGGTVAACGLAGGMDLPTTVAPFILRGVSLVGIDFGHVSTAVTARGLAAPRRRPRQGKDRGDDHRDRAERGYRGRPPHRRGAGARADGGENSVKTGTILLTKSGDHARPYGKGTVKEFR